MACERTTRPAYVEHHAPRPGQPDGIDEARVIQGVGDDMILRPQNRRYRARIGGEAGLEHDARFHFFEFRDAPLQFHVQRHRTGDGAHRSGSGPESPRRVDCRFL